MRLLSFRHDDDSVRGVGEVDGQAKDSLNRPKPHDGQTTLDVWRTSHRGRKTDHSFCGCVNRTRFGTHRPWISSASVASPPFSWAAPSSSPSPHHSLLLAPKTSFRPLNQQQLRRRRRMSMKFSVSTAPVQPIPQSACGTLWPNLPNKSRCPLGSLTVPWEVGRA